MNCEKKKTKKRWVKILVRPFSISGSEFLKFKFAPFLDILQAKGCINDKPSQLWDILLGKHMGHHEQ